MFVLRQDKDFTHIRVKGFYLNIPFEAFLLPVNGFVLINNTISRYSFILEFILLSHSDEIELLDNKEH